MCGPISYNMLSKYFCTWRDDKTRFIFGVLLKQKSDTATKFSEFLEHIQNQFKITPKYLRTDRGGEYTGEEIQKILRGKGIVHETTVPDTSSENGVAERLNGLIMNKVHVLLENANLSGEFWLHAFLHAIYLLNRHLSKKLDNKTPYKLW